VRQAGPTHGKELNHEQIEPIRRSFDFARQWLRSYDPDVMPWEGGGSHTRDYEYRLMDALIEAFPDLWRQGRLRLMPAVDVWSLLDRWIRAGQIAGLTNVGEFHTDGGHTRAGLPAYICAATFYTMYFSDRPHSVDYTIFNDRPGYGQDLFNDWGVLLEITPGLAKAVNDAIWQVVQAHPYTGFDGSKEALEQLEASIPCPEPVRVLEFGSTPGLLPSRIQCALPAWQSDIDRAAGKLSAWHVCYTAWYTMARYAEEMKKGGTREAYGQLTDKNWPTARFDRLILDPFGNSEQEADGTAWLAGQFLDHHPEGEVLLYFTWPEMRQATELRKGLKLEPWQPTPEKEMASLRKSFDYGAVWEADSPADSNAACMRLMFEAIKGRLPRDQGRRLRVIPAGALLAALDKELKAGALPGVTGAGEFYKDGVMLRTGLPRYALAALRHAVVHQSDPKALDAELFHDPKAYPPDEIDPETPKGQLKQIIEDDDYDNGPHFPITPEGKKLVDDTVWEVVRQQGAAR